jgi:hypothetical protein
MWMKAAPPMAAAAGTKILKPEQGFSGGITGIESKISFLPLVKYLKEKRLATSGLRSAFYQNLIDKFEAEPELLEPITDISLINGHTDLLELLANAIFPMVGDHEKNIFTFSAPYQFQIFYYSELFRKLFINNDQDYLMLPEGISERSLKEVQCASIYEQILQKFYGIKLNESAELVYPVVDDKSGMKHFYRMRYDKRFIDIQLKGKLPDIQNCAVCMNTFRILDLDKQLKTMPLELFRVEGFAVWVAEDVTTNQSLEIIKKTLLRQDDCDTGIIQDLKRAIHTLVGLNDVEVGLMPFLKVNDEFVLDDECTKHSLIGKNWNSSEKESVETFKTLIDFLHQMPGAAPVSNLTDDILQMLPFMKAVLDNGIRSYISYPMQNSDGLLGVLELGSSVPQLLNQDVLSRLEPLMPLLSLAMLKNRETFNNKIEREIKEKFTALQPSVEWKFADVAWKFMKKNKDLMADEAGKVVFDDVYPLYGAIDIRNSSHERNYAIQKDLKAYLQLVDETLDKMESFAELPLLEDLKFKNLNFTKSIEEQMSAQDEIRISEFLENELEPIYIHLQRTNTRDKELLDRYFETTRDCDGYLYHFRREYEATMTAINREVLAYLEKEEDQTQKSYPHYFEKYRTDGVEYNIYIGQSISPQKPFDLLYLKNIRLWQLKSMAEIARITHKLLPSLKVPLQTTQLILTHSHPISISFRKDERRFDVEGSYNIRYEVIKKRLDKVRVKDTNERLTQAGKIAIVYSNQKEVQEYQAYIELLQNKKILKPSIEFLELEDLQGIRGLKALRVDIELE